MLLKPTDRLLRRLFPRRLHRFVLQIGPASEPVRRGGVLIVDRDRDRVLRLDPVENRERGGFLVVKDVVLFGWRGAQASERAQTDTLRNAMNTRDRPTHARRGLSRPVSGHSQNRRGRVCRGGRKPRHRSATARRRAGSRGRRRSSSCARVQGLLSGEKSGRRMK